MWRLKKGYDRRIRQGHPWVYAHEIMDPIRNFRIQDVVELQDSDGNFIARGYGNPDSKIIFRAMTFSSSEKNPLAIESIQGKLVQAWKKRFDLGFDASFRLCYSESDQIPGLIIDRFLVIGNTNHSSAGLVDIDRCSPVNSANADHQVFAVQVLTAGIQKNIPDVLTLLKTVNEQAISCKMTDVGWERTSVVLRNDVKVRVLEGLKVEPPRFLKIISGYEATDSWIKIKSVANQMDLGNSQDRTSENKLLNSSTVAMNCDLYQGQKTGFFLDQMGNITAVARVLNQQIESLRKKSAESLPQIEAAPLGQNKDSFKILDLCSYVGHWSVQIGTFLNQKGISVHSTIVDSSKEALSRAKKNTENAKIQTDSYNLDVLKGLDVLPSDHYDLVIADPPAFVKAKKDIPTGKHAYQKLNTQAFRVVKSGGIVVSCSCSGLISENDLLEAVNKAAVKCHKKVQLVSRGGPAEDHPKLPGFAEGSYLKMLVHQV